MEQHRYRFIDALKFLSPYIKQYKITFLLFYLGWLIITLTRISITKLMGRMLDYAIAAQLSMFYRTGLIIGGLFFIIWIIEFGNYRAHNRLMTSFARKIREDVYRHYSYLTYASFSKLEYGELTGDMDQYPMESVHFLVRGVCHQINRVITICFIVISVIQLDWILGGLFVLLSILSVWNVQKNQVKLGEQASKSQQEKAKYQSFVTETLEGLEEINLLHARKFVQQKFNHVMENLYSVEAKVLLHNVKIGNQLEALQMAVQVILYSYCIWLMYQGKTTMGTITVLLTFYSKCQHDMNELYEDWYESERRIPYIEKMQTMLGLDSEKNEGYRKLQNQGRYQIKFHKVSYEYQEGNGEKILSDLNLTIPKGKVIGIQGESGCGKSTLLSLVTRLNQPTKGRIFIGGYPIETIDLENLRQTIGVLCQESYVFDGTLKENLAIGNPAATSDQMIQACEQAGLGEMLESFKNGLDTYLGSQGVTLSGGEKQRVAIARLYLKHPPILILDEPTASLDVVTQEYIMKNWEQFFADKTVLLVSHRSELFRLCHRVYNLEKGEWCS